MKHPGEYLDLLRSMKQEWKWLLRYVRSYRFQILLYALMGVSGTAMGLGVSLTSKYLIDAVVSHSSETIVLSVSLAIGMAVAQVLLRTLTGWISTKVGTKINTEIRENIYEHILCARWENINGYHSGELLNRLEGDANTVAGSVISFIPNVITRISQFAGCLAIVLYYDPTMAVFALISAPFLVLISRTSTKMMRKFQKESREMNGKILSYSSESIQNLQTLKAFDLTRQYTENFRTMLGTYRSLQMEYSRFSLILSMGVSLLGLVVSYACYGWGVWRLWQGAITFGTMTLFLQISRQLTGSFSALVSLVPHVISIATSAGRIQELTDQPMEGDPDRQCVKDILPRAMEEGVTVSAEGITYTYRDGERPVLQNISFSAGPQETVAFVGPSGEGKTTILRLLLGIVTPQEGSLLMKVNGAAPVRISDSTRRFCSYVPQGSAVFSGTIAQNLRTVRPDATDAELIEALTIAEAWSFIQLLPKQLDTVMGERGLHFSEGQIQRISIARALLRNAPVLIMDEATSALDPQTEEKVLHNLMTCGKKWTCFLTTHRPSMLQYCTRVYRIDAGGAIVTDE